MGSVAQPLDRETRGEGGALRPSSRGQSIPLVQLSKSLRSLALMLQEPFACRRRIQSRQDTPVIKIFSPDEGFSASSIGL
jgi:hypothetical protein